MDLEENKYDAFLILLLLIIAFIIIPFYKEYFVYLTVLLFLIVDLLLFSILFNLAGLIGGSADDIRDGLTSHENIATFRRILTHLFELKRKYKHIIFISGDIHACGISEIVKNPGERPLVIPQIVSSPISYLPMPKPLLGQTTSTSEIDIFREQSIIGRNVFYTSKRNFVKIKPAIIGESKVNNYSIKFYLEGHVMPFCFNLKFYEESD